MLVISNSIKLEIITAHILYPSFKLDYLNRIKTTTIYKGLQTVAKSILKCFVEDFKTRYDETKLRKIFEKKGREAC